MRIGLMLEMHGTQDTPAPSPRSLQAAKAELVDKRARLGMLVGPPLYALNAIEPWFNFHDLTAVWIQLGTAFLMLCLMGLSYTAWGGQRKLAIFTSGFLLSVAGFEAVVCYEHAFMSSYSAGFPTVYAYYCVLIPTTVLESTLVGVAMVLLMAIPEAVITGDISRVGTAFISDVTSFGILLFGRHLANTQWTRQFTTHQTLLSTMHERESHLAKLAMVTRVHSEFISQAGHQFRTPITALQLIAEQLHCGRLSDEPHRSESYRRLVGATQKLHRTVEGLLEFGRMEAGAVSYRFENIDPAELVERIVNEFARDVEPGGHQIEIRVNEDTPLVHADRTTLEGVIRNLLDNAVKYSPESFKVCVNVGQEGGRASICVRDCGLGIDAAEQLHIFDKYTRGETAKKAGIGGTGVGLAMARRIVAAHGGEIRLESKVGEGSKFTVLLPAVKQR